MTRSPVAQQQQIGSFFAELGVDVSYWAALWHGYKVGHLIGTDLDRALRDLGLSAADIDLLGMLRTAEQQTLRPTDLARILNITNAALTSRIAKLVGNGLVERRPADVDRRAVLLKLTDQGIAAIDRAILTVEQHSHFVRSFQQLPEQDRAELARIMGDLHTLMDRYFVPASRGML